MSAKGSAPNRRVAAIQAKKKRKQPKKSKTVGEGGAANKDRDRARETRTEVDRNRSFEEVSKSHFINLFHSLSLFYGCLTN